jgi:RNA polymerase sigma factor (sigma-70 family)
MRKLAGNGNSLKPKMVGLHHGGRQFCVPSGLSSRESAKGDPSSALKIKCLIPRRSAINSQMPDANDMELLRDYARRNSDAAFAELVQRHVSLVFSVALRHVGIAAHAEEITQAVFIILARKADRLRPNTILEAWLYETTRLTALSFLRGERRRQFREQEAYMESALNETGTAVTTDGGAPDQNWNQLAPLLDEAMSRLGEKDRAAVVLRFFKNKKISDVAAAMQVSEAAAQRRVLRALEKLRKSFARRGVSSTTAILAGTIAAHSVQAAPAGLTKTISAVAVTKGATISTSTLTLIKGALKVMAWTKMKTVAAVGAIIIFAAGTTTGLVIQHSRQANGPTLLDAAGFRQSSSLEGHWKGSNTAHPGKICSVNISGDQIEYRGADANDWIRGKFVLNESTDPKQLNISILEPANSFILCLFRVDGDRITIAAAEHGSTHRPLDFRPSQQVDVLELQKY